MYIIICLLLYNILNFSYCIFSLYPLVWTIQLNVIKLLKNKALNRLHDLLLKTGPFLCGSFTVGWFKSFGTNVNFFFLNILLTTWLYFFLYKFCTDYRHCMPPYSSSECFKKQTKIFATWTFSDSQYTESYTESRCL